MVLSEANWNGKRRNLTLLNNQLKTQELQELISLRTNNLFPESNSITEIDREYFNIVKTEDGQSKFFKGKRIDSHQLLNYKRLQLVDNGDVDNVFSTFTNTKEIINQRIVSEKHPSFKFHIVSPDKKSKNKKPIVGLYLTNTN